MTVQELIERLKEFPPEMRVVLFDSENGSALDIFEVNTRRIFLCDFIRPTIEGKESEETVVLIDY